MELSSFCKVALKLSVWVITENGTVMSDSASLMYYLVWDPYSYSTHSCSAVSPGYCHTWQRRLMRSVRMEWGQYVMASTPPGTKGCNEKVGILFYQKSYTEKVDCKVYEVRNPSMINSPPPSPSPSTCLMIFLSNTGWLLIPIQWFLQCSKFTVLSLKCYCKMALKEWTPINRLWNFTSLCHC